ncbi:MAG TPA: hypothetical protein VGD97_01470 [Lacunisphaera sp.]
MKLILLLLVVHAAATPAFSTLDYLAVLSRDAETSKNLGLSKLSESERAEWNKVLAAVYQLGIESAKTTVTNQGPLNQSRDTAGPLSADRNAAIWMTKADLEGEEIIKLRNGAVFEVEIGIVGFGYGREVALIKEGMRWSLWIEGKREFRGRLLKMPEIGKPSSFKRSSIESVSSDGSIVKLIDGSIYEIDPLGRIDTSLWLTGSEVFVVNGSTLLNASGDGGSSIQARLLR